MNKLNIALTSLVLTFVLTSCTGDIVNTSEQPDTDATSIDYDTAVDASETVIAEARAFIPEAAIVKVDPSVKDLDTDFHRLSCSDTTSQYTNVVNYYLAEGTDEVAIIDEIRDTYVAAGWERADSLEEDLGEEEDPTGSYDQILRSPEKYGLTVSRGEDANGGTILQMTVFSPCVDNPTDKPARWGR
jgi:hypothetical protein